MATLTSQFGRLRDLTSFLDKDVGGDHRAVQAKTLDLLARDRARANVVSLLEELSGERGLGWSDIARLVGVSVQAITKWRRGESVSGEKRLAVARLAALLELLTDVPIADPAGWLEMPVLSGFSVRHLDFYASGRPDLLFDLAHLRVRPEDALAELDPAWREQYKLEHEVYQAEDGQLSVRRLR
jgi:transcriptional regulator with XRE-family HTH domain